jgi:hypothetical protein
VLLVLGWCLAGHTLAQTLLYPATHRPVRYETFRTSHFDLIYEVGAGAEAAEVAALLEAELPATFALVGRSWSFRMPVVLNRFNDRSNGFVTTVPFRQEIELPAIKGRILSPRHSSWLEAVAPHELMHAVHADYRGEGGVVKAARLLAPDVARSLNLLVPPGVAEGVAVLRESQLRPGAGRLHHAFFDMEFHAALHDGKAWSLAQMVEASAHTWPYDRHYNGGAHLFEYLSARDSSQFFRRALRLHQVFPWFGFGVELGYGTRQWPGALGRQMRRDLVREEQQRVEALGPLTAAARIAGAVGEFHRRPYWLDARTLVVYAQGYHLRPGFYRIDVATGTRTRIGTAAITEDYRYDVDGASLLFSRYVPDALFPTRRIAEAFRLDLATGDLERLTHGGRVFAPIATDSGGVLAFQNDGPYTRRVRITAEGTVEALESTARTSYLAQAGEGADTVLLLNRNGCQGLYRGENTDTATPWIQFQDASIYDLAWSVDHQWLFFTADPDGVANVYVYDVAQDRVLRLTNVAFGAFEPALSPDGQTLAFIQYQHERADLVQMPFDPAQGVVLPRDTWTYMPPAPPTLPVLAASLRRSPPTPYRAWQHLRPRLLYPILDSTDDLDPLDDGAMNRYEGMGLGLQGSDPLGQWVYAVEGRYRYDRPWGEVHLQTGRFLLRPRLSGFDRPSNVVVQFVDAQGNPVETRRTGRERRGVEAGLELPIVLESNVYRSQAAFLLEGAYQQERLFDGAGTTLLPFQGRWTLTPTAVLDYRLQANPRDLVPNTGTRLLVSSELDLHAGQGGLRRAMLAQLRQYLPVGRARNMGFRLDAGVLTQNQGSIYDLSRFLPRGHEEAFLDAGTFVRYGAEVVQPLAHIDDGLLILPVYLQAVYLFGFGESLHPLRDATSRRSAVGGGAGVQLRLFYYLTLDLRFGGAYLPEKGRFVAISR